MAIIKEAHISQIHYNMNIGITEPKYAILDDDTEVIVKLANGPEGNLVLFNEYICYRMALLLDIPMPHSGICVMDSNTEIFDFSIASSKNYGYAFYSRFMPKTTKLIPSIIPLIKNKEVFVRMLLFDHIINNRDRNEGNLLVRFYKDDISIKVIDHTHVFLNGAIWDANCLKRSMEENDLSNTEILEYNERLYRMFFRYLPITEELLNKESILFKSKINNAILRKFISLIPNEWYPAKEDIDTLIEYLMYRIDNSNTIISTILSYLK